MRRYTQSNGTIHYTLQCQNHDCLQRPSQQFIGRALLRETMTEAEIDAVPEFDTAGRERANVVRRDAASTWRSSFWERYTTYLESPEWASTRARIMHRAQTTAGGPTCEQCRRQGATCVHHLTYANVGHERDDELIALCKRCHQKAHPDKALR